MLPPGLSHMFTIFSSDSHDTHAKSHKMFLAEQKNILFHHNLCIYPLGGGGGNLFCTAKLWVSNKDPASSQVEKPIRPLHLASAVGQKTWWGSHPGL